MMGVNVSESDEFISFSLLDVFCFFVCLFFNRSDISQPFTLNLDSKPTFLFCHLKDFGCGDGGWTPVMKIDGNKVQLTFEMVTWIK